MPSIPALGAVVGAHGYNAMSADFRPFISRAEALAAVSPLRPWWWSFLARRGRIGGMVLLAVVLLFVVFPLSHGIATRLGVVVLVAVGCAIFVAIPTISGWRAAHPSGMRGAGPLLGLDICCAIMVAVGSLVVPSSTSATVSWRYVFLLIWIVPLIVGGVFAVHWTRLAVVVAACGVCLACGGAVVAGVSLVTVGVEAFWSLLTPVVVAMLAFLTLSALGEMVYRNFHVSNSAGVVVVHGPVRSRQLHDVAAVRRSGRRIDVVHSDGTTLFIADDRFWPPDAAAKMAATIGVPLVEMSGSSHSPMVTSA